MKKKKITRNSQKKFGFALLLDDLKNLRKLFKIAFALLIVTAIASSISNSFLRTADSDISYKAEFVECQNCDDVKSEAASLLTIIYNYKQQPSQLHTISFNNDISEVNNCTGLLTVKRLAVSKVEKWLAIRNLNYEVLAIRLDRQTRLWQSMTVPELLLRDPTRLLLLKPLNVLTEAIIHMLPNDYSQNKTASFILETAVKVIICNLLLYPIFDNLTGMNGDKFEATDLARNDYEEPQYRTLILNVVLNSAILIFFQLSLLQKKSFLIRQTPAMLLSAPRKIWFLVEAAFIFAQPIVKSLLPKIEKEEDELSSFTSATAASLVAGLSVGTNLWGGRSTARWKFVVNYAIPQLGGITKRLLVASRRTLLAALKRNVIDKKEVL